MYQNIELYEFNSKLIFKIKAKKINFKLNMLSRSAGKIIKEVLKNKNTNNIFLKSEDEYLNYMARKQAHISNSNKTQINLYLDEDEYLTQMAQKQARH